MEERSLITLEREIGAYKTWASPMVIKTGTDYQAAGQVLLKLKDVRIKVNEYFDEDIKKAHELHKSLTGKKKFFTDILTQAEGQTKLARITYEDAQEALRQKEQDKLDMIARERERKEKEALEARAKKAEEKGDSEKAEALRLRRDRIVIHTPQPLSRTTETQGISKRRTFKGEVIDLPILVKAVASGEAPLNLIAADQKAINSLARALEEEKTYHGIRFYSELTESVRSA